MLRATRAVSGVIMCRVIEVINCKIIYVAPSPILANNGCPEFSPLTPLRLGLNLLAAVDHEDWIIVKSAGHSVPGRN